MVKGTSRRVIVVDSPDTELFEQAIFIVRNDAMNRNGVTAQRLVDEACRVARTCGRTATCSKRSFFRRGSPPPRGGGGCFLPFSRSSVYLSPTSIVPVRRDELRENVLRLLRARTIAVIGKIQILFHKLFFIFCR